MFSSSSASLPDLPQTSSSRPHRFSSQEASEDIGDKSQPSSYTMGHNNRLNFLQRRARCWGIYRRRYCNWSEQASSSIHPSSHQQQDGDPATSDAHVDTGVRYAPYAIPRYHRRGSFRKQDQTRANVEREQKPPERRMEGNRQDETLGSWFKIIIPFGIKYDEKWLLSLIQKQCSVSFTPVEFHYERMQAQFFVENPSVAFALKNVNGKIWDENNEMISIFVSPSDAPSSVQKEMKSEKLTTNKQYDVSQQSLDIQRLRFDPDLMTHGVERVPNPRNGMAASLQIQEENMHKLLPLNLSNTKPYQLGGLSTTMQNASNIKHLNLSSNEVKSAGKLDKGKGREPEEMCANRTPLYATFPDKSTNISSILEMFPKLLRLDGQESRPPTNLGIESHKRLPTCKGSFFESDVLKSLVLHFLQQYYLIYDSGDRQGLVGAYHDKACFSLTISFNPRDAAPSNLYGYFKDNRNIKKLKDPYLRVQLLKHTKDDIVRSLCVLPKTQHDFSSFLVDMWLHTERMLCFSVNGVFKEVVGESQSSVHAFTRTFIAIPANNSSLCIMNDQLFVRDTTRSETLSAFFIPVPKPTSSSVPTLSQEQQEMVQAFSTQSGMNLQWSQKCLHDSHWDYTRAAQILTLPKSQCKIPEETLTQTDPGS
ncbi:PREDICTED: nuclear RNA export factor 3 [Ceratotherium simum simum]|uniref:Nuclear RNA export factor 3 n=1 Tax=Ceratotherium simum simum TaxID=73337 RepID=A0ABM1C6E1_CERSS|nr:PREDICTED: nuclear RNA export factor 3 [Ceratotherium simum simum]